MKKHLREIEISGIILMLIGAIMHRFFHIGSGLYICCVGLILWFFNLIYKAFHWKEYERDNKQYIVIVLIAILILIVQMIFRQ